MSARMDTCMDCRFWKRREAATIMPAEAIGAVATSPIPSMGECRRHAPNAMDNGWLTEAQTGLMQRLTPTVWPETAESDWCGDFDVKRRG